MEGNFVWRLQLIPRFFLIVPFHANEFAVFGFNQRFSGLRGYHNFFFISLAFRGFSCLHSIRFSYPILPFLSPWLALALVVGVFIISTRNVPARLTFMVDIYIHTSMRLYTCPNPFGWRPIYVRKAKWIVRLNHSTFPLVWGCYVVV